jgi:hypothetical protein
VLQFRSRTVWLVLAIFVAGVVTSSIAPLIEADHALAHAVGGVTLVDSGAAGTSDGSGGDGPKCNHACHLFQHFQGVTDQLTVIAVEPWSVAYDATEPDAPPQLYFDTYLRPPRAPFRTV